MSDERDRSPRLPREDGPLYREDIEQQDRLRDDLRNQAPHQAQPSTATPDGGRGDETGTARRAESAAGVRPHEEHADDALRALDESGGDRAPRAPDYVRDERGEPRSGDTRGDTRGD